MKASGVEPSFMLVCGRHEPGDFSFMLDGYGDVASILDRRTHRDETVGSNQNRL